jgi:aubergine-like protein
MRANFQMMKALGEYTRMNPNHRVDRLKKFSARLRDTKDCYDTMLRFGVKMEPELMTIGARILEPEKILFGNGRQENPDLKTADWTPALRNAAQYASEELTKWVLMRPVKAAGDTARFLDMMYEVSRGLQFTISPPKIIELNDDRTGTYVTELQKICPKDPKLIMIVLMGMNNNYFKYSFLIFI